MKKKKLILNGMRKTKLKKKLGLKCVYCGCTNPLVLTLDHKKPIARGGADEDSNKQVCCFICNQLKDRLSHGEFKIYYRNLISMHKLHKISVYMEDPKVVFHEKNYPISEKELVKKIKEDNERIKALQEGGEQ